MQLFADENVALIVIQYLTERGHDTVRISNADLRSSDLQVLDLATRSERTLLTFDSDFGELTVRRGIAAPFGIVYCRLALLENRDAGPRIAEAVDNLGAFENRLVVIEEDKVRIRTLANLQQDNP